jgi:hypothetical protein
MCVFLTSNQVTTKNQHPSRINSKINSLAWEVQSRQDVYADRDCLHSSNVDADNSRRYCCNWIHIIPTQIPENLDAVSCLKWVSVCCSITKDTSVLSQFLAGWSSYSMLVLISVLKFWSHDSIRAATPEHNVSNSRHHFCNLEFHKRTNALFYNLFLLSFA